MSFFNSFKSDTLAISLGSNLPSAIGSPFNTIINLRPIIEETICTWIKKNNFETFNEDSKRNNLRFMWSPLFNTEPIEVNYKQPDFINTVLIIQGKLLQPPCKESALLLLNEFKNLEIFYGRKKSDQNLEHSPRTLDIDILWWGNLQVSNHELTIPHSRLFTRNFVITPISKILERTQPIQALQSPKGWETDTIIKKL
tara:strand:+ start:1169 stop:1762 length:594 start_codon:yes stop_codon:yes gene_type:complete